MASRYDKVHIAALEANVTGHVSTEERVYISVALHVKHESVRVRYVDLIATVLKASRASRTELSVLDLGCGCRLITRLWWECGARITAVDCSPDFLKLLAGRAFQSHSDVTAVISDVTAFAGSCPDRFDVVTLVSTLHHVPAHLSLVVAALDLVAPAGSLLTSQDPIRYGTLSLFERCASEVSYLAWRVTKGNYIRGIRARWRRLRGTLSDAERSDCMAYHVVNGVDTSAIAELLRSHFQDVRISEYWSTRSAPLHKAGERVGLRSTFALVAMFVHRHSYTGRRIACFTRVTAQAQLRPDPWDWPHHCSS